MEQTLTIKQRKFLKYYLELGNVTQAALKAGYKQGQSGFENLEKPLVALAFQELLDKEGLSDKALLEAMKRGLEATKFISCNIYVDKNGEMKGADGATNDFVEVPDTPTQLKAADMLIKLRSHIYQKDQQEPATSNSIETFFIEFIKKHKDTLAEQGIDGVKIVTREPRALQKYLSS